MFDFQRASSMIIRVIQTYMSSWWLIISKHTCHILSLGGPRLHLGVQLYPPATKCWSCSGKTWILEACHCIRTNHLGNRESQQHKATSVITNRSDEWLERNIQVVRMGLSRILVAKEQELNRIYVYGHALRHAMYYGDVKYVYIKTIYKCTTVYTYRDWYAVYITMAAHICEPTKNWTFGKLWHVPSTAFDLYLKTLHAMVIFPWHTINCCRMSPLYRGKPKGQLLSSGCLCTRVHVYVCISTYICVYIYI